MGTTLTKDSAIRAIKPANKEQWYCIEEGLYLRVRPNGKKHFVSRYSINKKQRKLTLGEYPALKLAQARKMNLEVREKLAQGIDSLLEKQEKEEQLKQSEKLQIEENINKHKFEDVAMEWLTFKEKNIADVTYFKLYNRVKLLVTFTWR